MSLLRAFIAVEIPLEIRESVCKAIAPLQKGLGSMVRWVPMENMHLTLKFLGDVSPANVEMLSEMLRAEADLFHCFDLRLNGLATLDGLQRGMESASRRLGYESEERGFSPHLTIGRVKQTATATEQQSIRRALEKTRIDSLGTARVDSVHLYKSDLKPTGSVYTRLFSAPLKR
jgi:2'-5' RNA ligase